MQFSHLDHIAIAVSDTEAALKIWRDKLGFKVLYAETVNGNSVLLTHLDLGNAQLQLVQPLTKDSRLVIALKEKGPHLHHFCLYVDDVNQSWSDLKTRGIGTASGIHQGTNEKRALFVNINETDGIQLEITGR
ncbi:MAG TPA: VOC family protein [Puia sp.]